MKAKLTPMVQQIRGRIGSTIFRHAGGSVVNVSASPVNIGIHTQGLPWQVVSQQYLNRRFDGLRPDQVRAWKYYEWYLWKNTKEWFWEPPTGKRAYFIVNLYRHRTTLPVLDDPPASPTRLAIPDPLIDVFPTALRLSDAKDVPAANQWFYWTISKPYSNARRTLAADTMYWRLVTGPVIGLYYWFFPTPYFPGSKSTTSIVWINDDNAPSRKYEAQFLWL